MGPSSGLAAVAAAAVLAAGLSGEQAAATFVAGITLASGLLFVLLAVFRMGWISQFLSRAVVTGFLFGAAIDVVIGELPEAHGHRRQRRQLVPGAALVARQPGRHELARRWSWVPSRSRSSSGCRQVAPRVPGALVLVVGGLLASWLLDLEAAGRRRGGPGPARPAVASTSPTSG